MDKTTVGAFSAHNKAEEAIHKLEGKGFTDKEVSLISKEGDQGAAQGKNGEGNNLKGGLTWGAGVGGTAGLLAGLGMLAIPGVGPLLAAGPIAATLAGGAAGGLLGGLMDYGIPQQSSKRYEEEVKKGETLVIVRAAEQKAHDAKSILEQCGAHDIEID